MLLRAPPSQAIWYSATGLRRVPGHAVAVAILVRKRVAALGSQPVTSGRRLREGYGGASTKQEEGDAVCPSYSQDPLQGSCHKEFLNLEPSENSWRCEPCFRTKCGFRARASRPGLAECLAEAQVHPRAQML